MFYIIDTDDEGKRLDLYLAEITEGMSRSKIQSQIKQGNILVNGVLCKPSYQLKENDRVDVNLIQEELEKSKELKEWPYPHDCMFEAEE